MRAANDGVVTFAGERRGHAARRRRPRRRSAHVVLVPRVGRRARRGRRSPAATSSAPPVASGDAHDGSALHFGLRVGDRYVDPMQLFRPVDLTKLVHLVPADEPAEAPGRRPASGAELRRRCGSHCPGRSTGRGLAVDDGGCGDGVPLVGGLISEACTVADWLGDRAATARRCGAALPQTVTGVADAFVGLARRRCTPPSTRCAPSRRARARARAHTAGPDRARHRRDGTPVRRHRHRRVRRRRARSRRHRWLRPSGDGGRRDQQLRRGVGRGPTVGLDVKALGYYPTRVRSVTSRTRPTAARTPRPTRSAISTSPRTQLPQQLRAMQREQPGREVDLVGHSQGGIVSTCSSRSSTTPRIPRCRRSATSSRCRRRTKARRSPPRPARSARRARAGWCSTTWSAIASPSVPPAGSTAVGSWPRGRASIKNLFDAASRSTSTSPPSARTEDSSCPRRTSRCPGATETVVRRVDDRFNEHSAIVADADALRAVRGSAGRAPAAVRRRADRAARRGGAGRDQPGGAHDRERRGRGPGWRCRMNRSFVRSVVVIAVVVFGSVVVDAVPVRADGPVVWRATMRGPWELAADSAGVVVVMQEPGVRALDRDGRERWRGAGRRSPAGRAGARRWHRARRRRGGRHRTRPSRRHPPVATSDGRRHLLGGGGGWRRARGGPGGHAHRVRRHDRRHPLVGAAPGVALVGPAGRPGGRCGRRVLARDGRGRGAGPRPRRRCAPVAGADGRVLSRAGTARRARRARGGRLPPPGVGRGARRRHGRATVADAGDRVVRGGDRARRRRP